MKSYISIRHSAPNKWIYYRKGKEYTYEEYCKLIHRRQQIKEIALSIAFGVFIALRAYVFFEYGI